MVAFQYKGRIHRGKFSLRSVRYVLSDQAARLFPALQKRWLFPVESMPIWEAASAEIALPSVIIDAEMPAPLKALGREHPIPLQVVRHFYSLDNVVVTGWAGAMIKDGLLLTVRAKHNWASALRAHPHKLRSLPADRPYFNLMAPIPARGHIFHWLFDSLIPLLSYLEHVGPEERRIGLIVNGARHPIQEKTIQYVKRRYGLSHIEPVGQFEAAFVPELRAAIGIPYNHRALQTAAGFACLGDLADFMSADATSIDSPKRIYISRNDARLRRVTNEEEILPVLKEFGFERVVLGWLPIAHQARLFRDAEAIIAPHGGGLAHICWCRPEAKLLEIFPDPAGKPLRVNVDYWQICQMRGLFYRAYLASPILDRHDSFRIEAETIISACREAGIAPA